MKETAFQKIKDPHNFALELWSTCGIAALLALAVAIAAFFWRTRRAWVETQNGQENETAISEARWPFYLGGMGGLTLAFVLWSLDLGRENLSDQMTVGTCLAGMRSLVWFAAFGLFESIPWIGRSRVRALTIGMTALLTTLLVTGGISYPSVAQPMWIVAALAVNSLGQAAVVPSRSWLRVMTPLPVTAAVCLGFVVFIYSPVASCSGPLREARSYYGTYSVKTEEAQQARSMVVGQKASADAQKTLEHVINQLKLSAYGTIKQKHEAVLADPYVELAEWLGVEWERNYQHGQAQIEVRQSAASAAEHAIRLDPEGQAGYWAKYHVNMIFAKGAVTQTRKFHEDAAKAISELVKRDPTEAKLHFELGDLQFQLDDLAGWEKESQEALRLDQIATDLTRQLRHSQLLVIQSRKEPTNIGLRFDLAQAFYREGDTEKGKKTAEEVQRMDQETNSPARLTDSQRQQVQAWLKPG
jgi:tetratricopeptide (TPR) repeat protein